MAASGRTDATDEHEGREVIVRLHHPDAFELSDHTTRRLLRDLAGILRRIQLDELRELVYSLPIPGKQQKRVYEQAAKLQRAYPSYYVEEFQKGSLEVLLILSAFGLYILKLTIGEDVRAAWKGTNTSRKIREYLRKDLWGKRVAKRVKDELSEKHALSRFEVEDVSISTNGDYRIDVKLKTATDATQKKISERIDVESAKRELRSVLS
jgi:hypothetical protein